MKVTKVLSILLISASMLATEAYSASVGRAGGGFSGGRSSSSSISRPSTPHVAPSTPHVAPAPSHPGGIGGTTASVGVRKSEVTAPVRNEVAQSKPSTTSVGSTSSGSYTPHYTPTPSYGYATPPAPQVTNGSTFMSSLGGSMLGTMLGNSISHPHSSGTTVINNGTPSSSGVISSANAQGTSDSQFNPGGVTTVPKKEYSVWSFIADLFGFIIVVGLLLGAAWLFYKGYQLVRDYINKERGVSNIPFQPTQKFWEIQKAFAAADETALRKLLGPDVVDELTNGLQPQTLTLKNVSHEVRLANNTEFSIWYKFEDDGEEVNQVWHYERFGSEWKLNGIENV